MNNFVKSFKSSAVAALALFGCVNVAFDQVISSGNFDRFEASQHRETYWHLKQYRKLTAAPDVLLIGSSLLVRVATDGEATYLRKPINVVEHKRLIHLEEAVQKRTGVAPTTFAFDLHGLHASDAAVLLHGALGDKLPSTIVYTVAPRDFADNMLTAPDSTEQFKLMSRVSDMSPFNDFAAVHRADKFDFAVEHRCSDIFALVRCHSEIATVLERKWRQKYVPAVESFTARAVPPGELYLGITPFDYPEEEMVAPQLTLNDCAHSNNLGSYEICYNPYHKKNYDVQLFYLDYMLKTAKAHGVNVILVNMPLRKDNLSAMPKKLLCDYSHDLPLHAAANGAKYVDLYDSRKFVDSDFMDSVHLTGFGANKLVEALADKISQDLAVNILVHRANQQQLNASRRSKSGLASHALHAPTQSKTY